MVTSFSLPAPRQLLQLRRHDMRPHDVRPHSKLHDQLLEAATHAPPPIPARDTAAAAATPQSAVQQCLSRLGNRDVSPKVEVKDDSKISPVEADTLFQKGKDVSRRTNVITFETRRPSHDSGTTLWSSTTPPYSTAQMKAAIARTAAQGRLAEARHLLLDLLERVTAVFSKDERCRTNREAKLVWYLKALRCRVLLKYRLIHRPGDVGQVFKPRNPNMDPEMRAQRAWFWRDETTRRGQRESVAIRWERRRLRRDQEDPAKSLREKARRTIKSALIMEERRKKTQRPVDDISVELSVAESVGANTNTLAVDNRQARDDAGAVADNDAARRIVTSDSSQPDRRTPPPHYLRHWKRQPLPYHDSIADFSETWTRCQNDNYHSNLTENIEPKVQETRADFAPASVVDIPDQNSTAIISPLLIDRPVSVALSSSTSSSSQRNQVPVREYWHRIAAKQSRSGISGDQQAGQSVCRGLGDEDGGDDYHDWLLTMVARPRGGVSK